jgi:hypothetical protein
MIEPFTRGRVSERHVSAAAAGSKPVRLYGNSCQALNT